MLQLLPLNDTGGVQSPYDALSVFALNPIHISLTGEGDRELNSLKHIDYKEVWKRKEAHLRGAFANHWDEIKKGLAYKTFQENNPWLHDYGSFRGDVDFYTFLQFIAFEQMRQVKEHANRQNILLKGDIPILLSKKSVDVKTHFNFFLTHLNVGCPPDKYIPQGQNWHFPLYDWEKHFDEAINWWKSRLKTAEYFYHLYRLDHVVGLFRIWAIPLGKKATEGHFIPRHPKQWIAQGKKILQMMQNYTDMIPIAEDLGLVPKSVKNCLTELGIPGTCVVRWSRTRETEGRYLRAEQYPALSMTTLSTHDTETLAQWWGSRPEEARPFAKMMGMKWQKRLLPEQRLEILRFSHQTNSLYHINLLQEWLALFEDLVWERLSDERINIPGKNMQTNWRYRFRPNLESLVQDKRLKDAIAYCLK